MSKLQEITAGIQHRAIRKLVWHAGLLIVCATIVVVFAFVPAIKASPTQWTTGLIIAITSLSVICNMWYVSLTMVAMTVTKKFVEDVFRKEQAMSYKLAKNVKKSIDEADIYTEISGNGTHGS